MKIGTKQIALLAVAVMLLAVGYKHEELAALWNGRQTKEAVSTPTGSQETEKEETKDAFVHAGLPFDTERLDRDRARGITKETYEAITADKNASEETQKEAYAHLLLLAQQTEQERKVEGLIREKGFADAYACYSDLGEMDIVIKAKELSEQEVTQIADIIVRYTGLQYSAIHIRKVA